MLLDLFFVLAVWCSYDIMICKTRIACYSHRMGLKSSMLKGKLCGAINQGSMLNLTMVKRS